ncbi:hypothetical protein [Halarcobacter ebronensis]|uniref:Flagellar protein FlgJ N-terminal domain-containing protein n=1 Tax=Halarcobacter ebronensis TaxID=1462615 RepID=A0A4Q1AMJ7_9BACT|nr:hypothetical protein [Halarcobacter ebronensis]QKF82900.1 putative flagellar rod assembly protein FlgJ [Halarcobacter ebronensis]RXK06917.1 hypothetical protein CRV07_05675 [Halarcobacter ebronensis]
MEINTSFPDVNMVKANSAKSYENIDTSKLEDEALRKVANDFEAFFMQQLLDVSLKDVNVAGEGNAGEIIKGMYTEAISSQSTGSVGISDLLYNFLSENNK